MRVGRTSVTPALLKGNPDVELAGVVGRFASFKRLKSNRFAASPCLLQFAHKASQIRRSQPMCVVSARMMKPSNVLNMALRQRTCCIPLVWPLRDSASNCSNTLAGSFKYSREGLRRPPSQTTRTPAPTSASAWHQLLYEMTSPAAAYRTEESIELASQGCQ